MAIDHVELWAFGKTGSAPPSRVAANLSELALGLEPLTKHLEDFVVRTSAMKGVQPGGSDSYVGLGPLQEGKVFPGIKDPLKAGDRLTIKREVKPGQLPSGHESGTVGEGD